MQRAASAAATTCSSVASGRPKAMFARTVVLNTNVSWRITPNWLRSDATVSVAHVVAVEEHAARVGSQKRSRRFSRLVLPAPDGPTNATCEPIGIFRLTVSSAGRPGP